MASVSRRLLRKETIPCISNTMRRLFSTGGSSSFAQRLRDLPKDFPSTNAKRDASLLIGRTPLVFLNKVTEGCEAYIAAKQEHFQPTCSIKDRPAMAMVVDAEKKKLITPGITTLIEPTSGNMGISMAFMAAMKGYRIIMTMPSYTSLERRVTMRSFGAELVVTDPAKGMGGTVKKAYDLLENTPDAFMLQQFANPANTQIHYDTTGPEIWEDTLGNVDIFVMGIGSGGTVSGVGQYLKSKNPNVKIYGVEPAESNVLNGGKPGPHAITGNGVGFKPDILDMDVMEKVLEVSSEDSIKMARELALKEGLMGLVLDILYLLKHSWTNMAIDVAKSQAMIAAEAIPVLQMLMKTRLPRFHDKADSLLHCLPGCLTVNVMRANNLKQSMGTTNAFCQLTIGNCPPRHTKVVSNRTSPEWKEGFTWAFDVPPKGQTLHIICKSKSTFGKATTL